MKIGKIKIDLHLLSIYIILGVFIQLFVVFWIWRENYDNYTIKQNEINSNKANELKEITNKANKVLLLAYILFFLFNGKRFFKKLDDKIKNLNKKIKM